MSENKFVTTFEILSRKDISRSTLLIFLTIEICTLADAWTVPGGTRSPLLVLSV